MSTTRTPAAAQAVSRSIERGELPPLNLTHRIALRVGLALILWSGRRADPDERTEHARRTRAAEHAEQARVTALQRRMQAGPTWWV